MKNVNGLRIKNETLVKYEGTDKKVIVPQGVTKIGKNAFEANQYIEEIKFEGKITSIADRAFFMCSNLCKIENLPNTIVEIGELILDHTEYYDNVDNWKNKCLYLNENLIFYKGKTIKKVSIRENTKTIAKSAFFDCKQLEEIVLPNGLENINMNAIVNCNRLKFIYYNGTKEYFKTINKDNNWFLCCGNFRGVYTENGLINVEDLI